MTSKATAHMPEPRYCACRGNVEDSPWHCDCGRWKLSGVTQCARCAAGQGDTDLNPRRPLIDFCRETVA